MFETLKIPIPKDVSKTKWVPKMVVFDENLCKSWNLQNNRLPLKDRMKDHKTFKAIRKSHGVTNMPQSEFSIYWVHTIRYN